MDTILSLESQEHFDYMQSFIHARTFPKAETKESVEIKEEVEACIKSLKFVEDNKMKIAEFFLERINLFHKLIIFYNKYNEKNVVNIYDKFLTNKDSKNTGSIGNTQVEGTLKSIQEILGWTSKTDANVCEIPNIRELMCIIDEIIHHNCDVIAWLVLEVTNNQSNEHSKYSRDTELQNLILNFDESSLQTKRDFAFEVITNQNSECVAKPQINEILSSVYRTFDTYLGHETKEEKNVNPWLMADVFPSLCHLMTTPMRMLRHQQVLSYHEAQRLSDYPIVNPQNATFRNRNQNNFRSDEERFKNSQEDIVELSEKHIFPPLSKREKEYFAKQHGGKIPWKGGSQYFPSNTDIVTTFISKKYNKSRTTSYSGHVILEAEFFYLFKHFSDLKEVIVVCTMASMIPYCHHTAHEILSSSTNFGIPYNIISSIGENIEILSNNMSNQYEKKSLINKKVLVPLSGGSVDYEHKYKKYKKLYIESKKN
jgi:hypothetical protein